MNLHENQFIDTSRRGIAYLAVRLLVLLGFIINGKIGATIIIRIGLDPETITVDTLGLMSIEGLFWAIALIIILGSRELMAVIILNLKLGKWGKRVSIVVGAFLLVAFCVMTGIVTFIGHFGSDFWKEVFVLDDIFYWSFLIWVFPVINAVQIIE